MSLASLGFEKNAVTTLSFNIDTDYESYRDHNNDWKKRIKGYKFTHSMKLEFPSDNALLGEVLYALAQCRAQPEFRILYTVKDVESSKNLLLAKAVEDSKGKAEVLAKAAGVELGKVLAIDYSWGEREISSEPVDRMLTAPTCLATGPASYDIDINPDDIDVTDTVTVVWEIQ